MRRTKPSTCTPSIVYAQDGPADLPSQGIHVVDGAINSKEVDGLQALLALNWASIPYCSVRAVVIRAHGKPSVIATYPSQCLALTHSHVSTCIHERIPQRFEVRNQDYLPWQVPYLRQQWPDIADV